MLTGTLAEVPPDLGKLIDTRRVCILFFEFFLFENNTGSGLLLRQVGEALLL